MMWPIGNLVLHTHVKIMTRYHHLTPINNLLLYIQGIFYYLARFAAQRLALILYIIGIIYVSCQCCNVMVGHCHLQHISYHPIKRITLGTLPHPINHSPLLALQDIGQLYASIQTFYWTLSNYSIYW